MRLSSNADIDAAERHLRDVLIRLDTYPGPGFSTEIEAFKVVALQYLGDYERAREIIGRTIPVKFGGERGIIEMSTGANWQLQAVVTKKNRQDASRAISMCFITKDWSRGAEVLKCIKQVFPTIFDDLRTSEDPDVWYEMVWIACIQEHNAEFGLAFDWYLRAFQVVEARREHLADVKYRRAFS